MRFAPTHALVLAAPLALALATPACASGDAGLTGSGGHAGATSTTTATGAAACHACVTRADCGATELCAQFGGDIYCAADCSGGAACPAGTRCATVAGWDGTQVDVCAPTSGPCALASGAGGAGATTTTTANQGETCGSLHGPDVTSCCASCTAGGSKPCQANGCYGGWWCNVQSCKCQSAPPSPCGGGTGGGGQTTTTTTSSTSTTTTTTESGGITGISDGKLDALSFAVVGDTRPPIDDDTAGYPTTIIDRIWKDVAAENPRPAFAVGTGDYMFAKAYGSQGSKQLDLYLAARAAFPGPLFPALGNHECTGAVTSNCGPGSADGITNNYTTFLNKMLKPLGVTQPWYTVTVASTQGAWTAKLVFIAANAWSSAQATWLDAELAKPTTYTFVIRHEGTTATTAPGVTPSGAIIAKHPYTLLVVGHTHTYAHYGKEKQLVVGNGGAPLTSQVNYGYVSVRQRPDGAIRVRSIDYESGAAVDDFALKPDGSPAP